MGVTIATIVEGHGEVSALPALIRRVAGVVAPRIQLVLPTPIRVKRDKFLRDETEFKRYVELAALRTEDDAGGILILLDSEGKCDRFTGPEVLLRAQRVRSDRVYSVVFAHHMYENWFVASVDSLTEAGFLEARTVAPEDTESVHGKGWIQSRMLSRKYSETIDQERLTLALNLNSARARSPSFDKLCRDLQRLLLRQGPARG